MTTRPLTEKQIFTLIAVEHGAIRVMRRRLAWRSIYIYVAWDSLVTTQVLGLMKRRLIVGACSEKGPRLTDLGRTELARAKENKKVMN
jgi:hypothetical protein